MPSAISTQFCLHGLQTEDLLLLQEASILSCLYLFVLVWVVSNISQFLPHEGDGRFKREKSDNQNYHPKEQHHIPQPGPGPKT